MRPTLATFRAQFPSEVMGTCQSDPQVVTYCNDAVERLMIDPMAPDEGWYSGWATMVFNISVVNGAAYVTAPLEVARIIAMTVCTKPIPIRNSFYEFLSFGRGLEPKTCSGTVCGSPFQAYERGNVATLAPLLSTAQIIRIYPTDSRDAGLRVLVQGKDANGLEVLTTDPGTGLSAPGEYVALGFPFVDTTNQFSAVNGLMKDQTYGPIQFFQVDPSTGAEATLSTMQMNEASASYRRYLINGIPNQTLCCTTSGTPTQITAQVRLCFVPVQNETDYLSISCVPAIIEEAISIRFSRMDSSNAAQQSAIHHGRALALLNGELDSHLGKVNTAINVPIFGSARVRPSFA